ncbi:GNAT family N-acetyltransferase [Catellatospora citrea]|uniref:GNAT family N-acetyltransferase n=1 Tax=Catellatospora citrea TaxID=53366 RepID=UPI0033D2C47E
MIATAQQVWLELAGVPVTFPAEGAEVAVSERSLLCPPGWCGIVTLGNAAIVTVPADDIAELVRQRLGGQRVAALTDPERLCRALPVAEVLGPATLAYCDKRSFRPTDPGVLDVIPADHADLAALLASVPPDDADECGLAEITSPAYVVRSGSHVVAAAGYRRWPGEAAHMCVLTAPPHRGRGLARIVGGAAVADALANDLLPQWRARPDPSRRVARALGFHELGTQLSIRITEPRAR